MGRIKRTDRNQKEVVEALRAIGVDVYPTHFVGRGFPDLVCGYRGKNYLVEVKDGEKPLTPDEQEFFDSWRGVVHLVTSVEDALELFA